MKKIALMFATILCAGVAYAQPSALVELWKSIDNLNRVTCQQTVDKVFLDDIKTSPSDRKVVSLDMPFGKSVNATLAELKQKGFVYEYAIEDSHKLSGEYMGYKCDLFFTALSNVVFEYIVLFKTEYDDFDVLKADFNTLEQTLNSIFGQPSFAGRGATSRYMPMSSVKNDKGITYGNVYHTADGTVFLHPTPYYSLSGRGEGAKLMVYFLHDESLDRALK